MPEVPGHFYRVIVDVKASAIQYFADDVSWADGVLALSLNKKLLAVFPAGKWIGFECVDNMKESDKLVNAIGRIP